MWLKDFLPEDLPEARIMTFGYDSDLGFTRSDSGITNFALGLLGEMRALRRGAEEVMSRNQKRKKKKEKRKKKKKQRP